MFSISESNSKVGFISREEWGQLRVDNRVIYCQVQFELDCFSEQDFTAYNIIRPSTLTTAVAKRQAEYLAGRYCCARLLMQLGLDRQVRQNADRSPSFPESISGSISHHHNQAIALLSDHENLAIGIDIEEYNPSVLQEIKKYITSEHERIQCLSLLCDESFLLLLAFSSKESLFKALYPRVGYYFGFECAEIISINSSQGEFNIKLVKNLNEKYCSGMVFKGFFSFEKNTIVTIVLIDS